MTKDELIELARKLIENDFSSEGEADSALFLLEENVPDPDISDKIFWPDPIDKELDPKEIIEEALSWKPNSDVD